MIVIDTDNQPPYKTDNNSNHDDNDEKSIAPTNVAVKTRIIITAIVMICMKEFNNVRKY
jgi:hypothetical protein